MKTFTISSSLRFYKEIQSLIEDSKNFNLEGLFPNLNSGENKKALTIDTLKSLAQAHFEAIDNSEALYVLCPDGYIGNSVRLEIGYALGRGIPVYYSEATKDPVFDGLCSGVIPVTNILKLSSL